MQARNSGEELERPFMDSQLLRDSGYGMPEFMGTDNVASSNEDRCVHVDPISRNDLHGFQIVHERAQT